MRGFHKTFSTLGALLAFALFQPAYAQEDGQDMPDPCQVEGACRVITEYVIEDPEGETHRFPVEQELPWVVQGNILVTPGEAVVVKLLEVDGSLVPQLRRVGDEARTADLEAGEVLFDFNAFERGNVTLVVQSNYPEALDYAALLVDMNSGPSRTSVCTLMPGVAVYEMWQQPIYQLALWSFRPTDGYSCSVIDPEATVSETN